MFCLVFQSAIKIKVDKTLLYFIIDYRKEVITMLRKREELVEKVNRLVEEFILTTGTNIKEKNFCKSKGLTPKEYAYFQERVFLRACQLVK
jgi:hypothetical protein